jgi:hypothetical protein
MRDTGPLVGNEPVVGIDFTGVKIMQRMLNILEIQQNG